MTPFDPIRHRSFLRLFTAHEAAISGFVRTLVPRREDVLDIMQDVAVVLWDKFGEFDASRDFRRWACGVARMEVLAFFRDRARDRHLFLEESLLELIASEGIEDAATDARREALEDCLSKLPQDQHRLILSAYELGNRIDHLASDRGQTAMSLYKQLHRIRILLMDCITRTISAEGAT